MLRAARCWRFNRYRFAEGCASTTQLSRIVLVAVRVALAEHERRRAQFLRGCIRYRQSLDDQLPAALRTRDEHDG
jgi:hypothetical protein